jgi:hypothetical protein
MARYQSRGLRESTESLFGADIGGSEDTHKPYADGTYVTYGTYKSITPRRSGRLIVSGRSAVKSPSAGTPLRPYALTLPDVRGVRDLWYRRWLVT